MSTTAAKTTTTTKRKNAASVRSHTYLEKLVSQTKKFKVEDLLDLYGVYDDLVVNFAFRHLLFPYTRFAKTWVRDQARDLLAGTDRNRLILTSRRRKTAETDFDDMTASQRSDWADTVKPRHTQFLSAAFALLQKHPTTGTFPTVEEIEALGVSRLVYDDMGAYFIALMNSYPAMMSDYCAALADGDHEEAVKIDCFLRTLEAEVGIRREDAWYVVLNMRSIYDQIERMVQGVTMAYARLLFRFAHRLRGVTSTEENFSAGYEGMIRAARNYDPVDGASFTAHCQWWVRSAVLQRQRQASVILLPTTTWYQLSLLQKGQIELTNDRVSDLKERAEMFYANSANAKKSHETDDADDASFEGIHVTSSDAQVVLGDSILHAQSVVEGYETKDTAAVGRDLLDDAFSLLQNEDPSLIFPVLLWSLNSGIDATMLAEVIAPMLVSDTDLETEHQRHKNIKAKHTKRTTTSI